MKVGGTQVRKRFDPIPGRATCLEVVHHGVDYSGGVVREQTRLHARRGGGGRRGGGAAGAGAGAVGCCRPRRRQVCEAALEGGVLDQLLQDLVCWGCVWSVFVGVCGWVFCGGCQAWLLGREGVVHRTVNSYTWEVLPESPPPL